MSSPIPCLHALPKTYSTSRQLLAELAYSNVTSAKQNDTLVFVGDLVAKHPNISRSLDTVDYIRSLNAASVRGNHDQDVINWRNYIDSSASYAALSNPETTSDAPDDAPADLKHKWRDEHFQIAKAMSNDAASWLANRSLTLHIRSLHAYVVHAGLLPWTVPRRKGSKKHGKADAQQIQNITLSDQLADIDFTNVYGINPETNLSQSSSLSSFIPVTAHPTSSSSNSEVASKLDPEVAILTVKLNRDPYTLLEMRSIKRNGKITKDAKVGKPWAPIWNVVMAGCEENMKEHKEKSRRTLTEARQGGAQDKGSKNKLERCRPLNVMFV